MKFPRAALERFARVAEVPSKDRGWIRCWPLFGGQRFALQEMERGFEEDIHEYVLLAGRQMGKTTLFDLLDLFWPQRYPGITGMMVSDDDANRDYRRDVLRQMLERLPSEWKYPVRLDNQLQLAWETVGSRLMFDAVGQRSNKSFGRSRGINYVHGDEVGAWPNQRAVQALRAALSDRHPHRLYGWPSTAQGYDVFHDMWKEAGHSPVMRQIFLGWWHHEVYRIEQTNKPVWDRYGKEEPTDEERIWLRAIDERYGVRVQPEQVVWYRYALDALFLGDEDMRAQEVPCLPEDAFVSWGEKFFRPALIRHLRDELATAPTPKGYRYRWAKYLDETPVDPCEPLTPGAITVWEEPDPHGVYIVSCHPAFSSTQTARDDVVQVWRAYPDALVQAAEYVLEGGGLTRHCAWAAMHLAGAYRMNRRNADVYFVLDVEMTGLAVLQEIKRYEDNNWGLAPRPDARDLRDLKGAIRHYYFRKPDTWSATAATEWKSQPSYRPWILNQLRDVVDNGQTTIRSPALVDELATVRRGELGDADAIAAGGNAGECRVIAMAMSVESWLSTVVDEIRGRFPTKEAPRQDRHVGEILVGNYLAALGNAGRVNRTR